MAFEKKKGNGDGEVFKFDGEGTSLTGIYVGRTEYQGDWAPTYKHQFKTDTGLKIVFGSKVLNDLLTDSELGKLVRITQERSKPSKKGNPTKMFTVEIDNEYQMDADELDTYGDTDLDSDDVPTDTVQAQRATRPQTAATVNQSSAERARAALASRKSS